MQTCPPTNSLGMAWIIQYIPINMHTVFVLLCFVVFLHWLIFPYPSGLLHWHCGNLTIALVPAKQPWWIWINTSCEFIMNDCITTTKQSTTKPCAYLLGYTVNIISAVMAAVMPWMSGRLGSGVVKKNYTLTNWGRDKMVTISQTTLSNVFSWMKMLKLRLKVHWSLFLRFELTIFQH